MTQPLVEWVDDREARGVFALLMGLAAQEELCLHAQAGWRACSVAAVALQKPLSNRHPLRHRQRATVCIRHIKFILMFCANS